MASLLFLNILPLLVLAAPAAATAAGKCAAPPDVGSTVRVLHAFGPCSPFRSSTSASGGSSSWEDALIKELQASDASRLLFLSSLAAGRSSVPLAPGRQLLQIPNYVVRAKLGSPPQTMLVALDTSNDAAWFPCSGCLGCPASAAFSSSLSSTFRQLPCGAPQCSQAPNPTPCSSASDSASACGFNLTYGSAAIEAGLAQDALALASDVVADYTFGCLQRVTGGGATLPPQGLLGLGRGSLSFLSQTNSLYSSTFSYCLPSFRSLNFSGSLRLGPVGQPKRIKTTPLLSNPRRPSLYYVNLIGIRVGGRTVSIPSSALTFDPATGAGTIVDSGTMFTRLVASAYAAVRDEFRRRMAKVAGAGNLTTLGGFDTCYDGPAAASAVPTVTLMFSGMNVTLPSENVVIRSSSGSITCLAMAAAPDNVNSVVNVIANMQQQNHRLLFDVPNARIGIARELCTA
ncbi:aspartyl protease AED3-like [Zingiber officinale]|uniref:Peptidase A1 domain-containing protein n=1 Tax=Zingiber officinale TaxID=94328 RepID=A0A8J5G3K6_ZINOF|nr:aspartyl protease AED3-like [Zingiber officinale]KAG6497737.1 hypothetical protein ZIOFF_045642 [Zingiber officinale]